MPDYRIKYKIVEGAKTYSGERVVEVPIDKYIEYIHRHYQDASFVYLELLEEIEKVEEPDYSSSSGYSVIIIP